MASNEPLVPADVPRLMRLISHELRNPLGALAIWLHLCRQTETPAERARALAMIEDCLQGLTRIAGHLEDCSALLEPGPRTPKPGVELAGLVRGVLEALRPAGARAGVTLDLEAPPSREELRVSVDAEQLARGLDALIRYALLEGGAQRRLVIRIEADAARVRVLVPLGRSTWSAMRSLHDHIAELPVSSSPSGLGVAIALELIRLHGGDLSHRAEPESGLLVVQLRRAAV